MAAGLPAMKYGAVAEDHRVDVFAVRVRGDGREPARPALREHLGGVEGTRDAQRAAVETDLSPGGLNHPFGVGVGLVLGSGASPPEQLSSMPLPGISTAIGEMFGSWSLQSPPPKYGEAPS